VVEIKGLEKFASKDFPGHISSTVFLPGCNFRCPFCHNSDLVLCPESLPSFDLNFFLGYLDSRKGWLDGLCLSGGEPLLHGDLEVLARIIKDRGYKLKIDTNGSFPNRLEQLIEEGLVDAIAMDIKGPLDRYPGIVRVAVDVEKIKQSVRIIKNSGLDYIFRLTVVPEIHQEKDLRAIGEWLKGASVFQLQQFFPQKTIDPAYLKVKPYPPEQLLAGAELLKPFFAEVRVEGV
jgi:pyruvate formate lyase activating enzyme